MFRLCLLLLALAGSSSRISTPEPLQPHLVPIGKLRSEPVVRPNISRRRNVGWRALKPVIYQLEKDDHLGVHIDGENAAPNWSGNEHHLFRPKEYTLMRHLLRYYDKHVRPVQPRGEQRMNITFGLALAQIIDVDEKNQLLTTNCWLNQAWMDFQLTWNPAEWDGIEVLRIPYEDVWRPDVVLYNSADVEAFFTAVSTNVIVQYTGNVTWLTMAIYLSTCLIDVQFFPFDTQNCTLRFSSWTYDGRQMGIDVFGEEGDVSNYVENSEWILVNFTQQRELQYFSCCPNDPYTFITFNIIINRRPLYYLFNLMIPCILITTIALLGFYVPANCGEKISMGLTTLVALAVFLMIVAESLPPTKQRVPLLGLYFGFSIAVVTCATALAVLSLNIHFAGGRGIRMYPFMRFVIFRILARAVFYKVYLPGDHIFGDDVKAGQIPLNLKLLKPTGKFCCHRSFQPPEQSGSGVNCEECGSEQLLMAKKVEPSTRKSPLKLKLLDPTCQFCCLAKWPQQSESGANCGECGSEELPTAKQVESSTRKSPLKLLETTRQLCCHCLFKTYEHAESGANCEECGSEELPRAKQVKSSTRKTPLRLLKPIRKLCYHRLFKGPEQSEPGVNCEESGSEELPTAEQIESSTHKIPLKLKLLKHTRKLCCHHLFKPPEQSESGVNCKECCSEELLTAEQFESPLNSRTKPTGSGFNLKTKGRPHDVFASKLQKLADVQDLHMTTELIKQAVADEWEQASAILDRCIVIVFLAVTVTTTAGICVHAPPELLFGYG